MMSLNPRKWDAIEWMLVVSVAGLSVLPFYCSHTINSAIERQRAEQQKAMEQCWLMCGKQGVEKLSHDGFGWSCKCAEVEP